MLLARLVSGIMPRKLRRTGRTKKQVTSDDKGSQKVDIDGIEEQERTMLRIALEEIKVQVEDNCSKLEMMTGDKIQKLKTELLKVLSVMSTADKDMTVREALALERAVAGSGNHSTMQPPPSRPMLPPATVRRAGGLTSAAPVPPGTRKRPRDNTSAFRAAPMATVKSNRSRPPIASVMQTPVGRSTRAMFATPRQCGITAATPATRRARRGEAVVSLNGSPLGPLGSHAVVAHHEPSISIELSGGNVLSTHQELPGELDAAAKQEAMEKLQRMQEQLASLMKSIA